MRLCSGRRSASICADPLEKNAWLHMADMVTAKYPTIKVEFQTAPFNDFSTKLTTQAASHSTPCVIGLQGQRAPQFGTC